MWLKNQTGLSALSPFGINCFNMMSLSLYGEPSTFMRLISEVKNSLTNAFAYLDDAMIYSESEEDY